MPNNNSLFDKGREGFLCGEINWATGTIHAFLLRDYTVLGGQANLAAHSTVQDLISAGADFAAMTLDPLQSKTWTNGIADADTITWHDVPPGPACTSVVFFQSSGPLGGPDLIPNSQRLITYIDWIDSGIGSGSNLNVVPDGDNIIFQPDNGEFKIFKL